MISEFLLSQRPREAECPAEELEKLKSLVDKCREGETIHAIALDLARAKYGDGLLAKLEISPEELHLWKNTSTR